MGAPKGNRFWLKREKSGRSKNFTPDELMSLAEDYFNWCYDNPLIEVDFRGKDLERIELPKMRAFTWDGLEIYLGIYSLRDYKTNPEYNDFSQVITRIGKIISTQKFEGAACGMLNANIIARDLGLKDNSDVTTNGKDMNIQLLSLNPLSENDNGTE